MYMYVYVHVGVCTCMCMYMFVYVHVCVCTCMCMLLLIGTYTLRPCYKMIDTHFFISRICIRYSYIFNKSIKIKIFYIDFKYKKGATQSRYQIIAILCLHFARCVLVIFATDCTKLVSLPA